MATIASLFPQPLSPSATKQRRSVAAAAQPKKSNASAGGESKRQWWAPLFHSVLKLEDEGIGGVREGTEAEAETERTRRRSRLTAEKAKMLRREMRATETWHDAMYHSAIASRLASSDHHAL